MQPVAYGSPAGSTTVDDRSCWLPPTSRPSTGPSATACCCCAPAQFQVVMPPTPQRSDPVEILLCAHHYRAYREALVEAGGAVYDRDGLLIDW